MKAARSDVTLERPKQQRPWLRFRLWHLLAITGLACIPIWHYGDAYRRTQVTERFMLAYGEGDTDELSRLLETHPWLASEIQERREKLLVFAAYVSHSAIVKLLMDHGWPVDERWRFDATIFHMMARGYAASDEDRGTTISLLRDAGLDPGTPDYFGLTAVHYAAYNDHEIVRQLIWHPSHITARDSTYGLTPIELAYWTESWNAVRVIREQAQLLNVDLPSDQEIDKKTRTLPNKLQLHFQQESHSASTTVWKRKPPIDPFMQLPF